MRSRSDRVRRFSALWFALLGLALTGAARAQVITEFGGLSARSQPEYITAGPDGNLWFTEEVANKIGRITPTGTVTEFNVTTAGSSPVGITAGPDGNIWFTEYDGDQIGRITPSGTITEFGGLSRGASPLTITAGSDGNLWFTEFGVNQIGQITPTGTVTEFFSGISEGAGPYAITAGPDGNVWFTEEFANRIAQITPTGTVTEFNGLASESEPVGITTGGDGNLWFTEQSADQIGRITPTGTVTEFNMGITSSAALFGIAAGPDGNVWFTEEVADQIGRITPTGTVTEFNSGITPGAVPFGITAGPDGALWFTEGVVSRIGRITTGTCPSITLSPASLPNGTLATAYSQTITASGGNAPYSFAVTAGSLPPGLSLANNGVLSGTPTASGSYGFTVTATDVNACKGSMAYSISVSCPVITLSPSELPDGVVGTAYSQGISGSGGTGPYSFLVSGGGLPPGLTLSRGGLLSGTPTSGGVFGFTVTATDGNGCTGSMTYSINVSGGGCPVILVSPVTLPAAVVNVVYSQTLSGSGGSGPYVFAVNSGSLPSGLTLSSAGVLSGTATSAGQSFFTVTATDTQGCVGGRGYFFSVVTCSIGITPASLPGGQLGVGYSQTITGTGGQGPYSVSLTSGSLPPGLTLSSSGLVSGTPTGVVGPFTFAVKVVDANGCQAQSTFTIGIVAGGLAIVSLSPSSAITGSGALTLTVDGSGFEDGSQVLWNGSARATTFVSGTRVTAAISAGDVATAGTETVMVENAGLTSNSVSFTVCDLPGLPTDLLVGNAANPAVGVSGSDPLSLSWQAPASGPVPSSYEFRINGDAETVLSGTSVIVPARDSDDPITLFVRALSCVPGSPGPEASTPVNLYAPAAPGTDFAVPPSPIVGEAVQFTDTSSPQATSWLWIFDDEATSEEQSPSHTFTQAGTHKVALIASNGSGSTVKIETVFVAPASGSRMAVAGASGARALFDVTNPERRRVEGVRLTGAGRTRLDLWSDPSVSVGQETVVFLRLLDEAGVVRLERRLVVGVGEDVSVNDIGVWGVSGTFTVELVCSQSYRAMLEGAEIVRGPIGIERPERLPVPAGGVR